MLEQGRFVKDISQSLQRTRATIRDAARREEVARFAGAELESKVVNKRLPALDVLEMYPTAALPPPESFWLCFPTQYVSPTILDHIVLTSHRPLASQRL